ncbi:GNAT family N-acetyltransferase [Roseibacterium sp. SDUM158017]|uniref:GNAT family N-acetyltransferase n=1 Tax=Roseicyclus salinarum TaxID=3036773 RepID=UPI0024150F5C|nr:GNAT family N-acetyltransferase [Roseibacterium sp. SDUM158017]MDG4648776.1 GNAT family N-acetyltransferase [Roseibacterium sp. SDUM158017]
MRPSLEAMGRFDLERARNRLLASFRAEETTILRADGQAAGFFVLRRRETHLLLDHLYLASAFQGQGIGRMVLERVQREACAAALPIRLTALNGSPANAFYRACGFNAVSSDALDTVLEWTPPA